MIECDTCNEWFHGFCVGLTEEESSKHPSYMCIGCARIIHKYDPLDLEPIYENDDQENKIVNPDLYKAFSFVKRIDY